MTCERRPAGRKTRVVTLTNDNCISGETIANFCVVVFRSERCETKEAVRLDVEAPKRNVHVLLYVRANGVKGMNPAPHIHEHLQYTIMATALRTPSRITTSCLHTAMNDKNTIAHDGRAQHAVLSTLRAAR